jgi:hypothetical protein
MLGNICLVTFVLLGILAARTVDASTARCERKQLKIATTYCRQLLSCESRSVAHAGIDISSCLAQAGAAAGLADILSDGVVGTSEMTVQILQGCDKNDVAANTLNSDLLTLAEPECYGRLAVMNTRRNGIRPSDLGNSVPAIDRITPGLNSTADTHSGADHDQHTRRS